MISLNGLVGFGQRSKRSHALLLGLGIGVLLSSCGRVGYGFSQADNPFGPPGSDAGPSGFADASITIGADGGRLDAGPGGFDGGGVGVDGNGIDSGTDSGTDAGPGLPSGLIAWYRFEDGPSDGVFDSSGNARHGDCSASDCPTTAPGRVGLAYDFDGVDDYVLVDDSDGYFNTPSAFTISCWTFVRGTGFHAIISKPVGDLFQNSWQIEVSPPDSASLTSIAGGADSAPGSFARNQWIHYAGTWDGSMMRFYRNGIELSSSPGSTVLFDNRAIVIGGDFNRDAFALPLEGLVDEFMIYDRALSAAEVATLATP